MCVCVCVCVWQTRKPGPVVCFKVQQSVRTPLPRDVAHERENASAEEAVDGREAHLVEQRQHGISTVSAVNASTRKHQLSNFLITEEAVSCGGTPKQVFLHTGRGCACIFILIRLHVFCKADRACWPNLCRVRCISARMENARSPLPLPRTRKTPWLSASVH